MASIAAISRRFNADPFETIAVSYNRMTPLMFLGMH
jgi:hypothetical protein